MIKEEEGKKMILVVFNFLKAAGKTKRRNAGQFIFFCNNNISSSKVNLSFCVVTK